VLNVSNNQGTTTQDHEEVPQLAPRMCSSESQGKHCLGGGEARTLALCGLNVDWDSHWNTAWMFLKKLKIELPHDPVVLFLGTYTKGMTSTPCKDVHPPVHCSVIHTASTWKALDCLSVVHIYSGVSLSLKKN
jgi:hypothetical protein